MELAYALSGNRAGAEDIAQGLDGLAIDDRWLWTVDFPGDTVTRVQLPR